jgi:hypothetical protein
MAFLPKIDALISVVLPFVLGRTPYSDVRHDSGGRHQNSGGSLERISANLLLAAVSLGLSVGVNFAPPTMLAGACDDKPGDLAAKNSLQLIGEGRDEPDRDEGLTGAEGMIDLAHKGIQILPQDRVEDGAVVAAHDASPSELSLPKSRFVRIDGAARQELDAQ